MIAYPDDRSIAAEADRHDIPEPVLVRDLVRVVEVLDGKLSTLKNLQPNIYAPFPNIEELIDDLAQKPQFNSMQWAKIMYLRNKRDRFSQAHLAAAVMGILVPGLKGT